MANAQVRAPETLLVLVCLLAILKSMLERSPLDELMCELAEDIAFAAGERPFPRTLTAAEAVAVVTALHGQIDIGVEVRAHSALQAGYRIACSPGCNACCNELIMVALPEAALVAHWLAQHPSERAAFVEAYGQWRHGLGDVPERITALIASGDEASHLQLYVEQFQRGVTCAFNIHGLCSVYPVRPMVCRVAHALDTADYCRGDSHDAPLPSRLSFVPLEQFVSRARHITLAAHHAMGGPSGVPVALCDAVYRMLSTGHLQVHPLPAQAPPSTPDGAPSCICDSTSPACESERDTEGGTGMVSRIEGAD